MKSLELFDLTGKTALVTGAARGLGREIALGLAEAGADICFCDLLEQEGMNTCSDIEACGRRACFSVVNVTKPGEVDRFVQSAIDQFGGIDILVNNVGIESEGCPIEEVSDEVWHRIMDANLSSMFYMARAAGKHMIARGKGGSIINMSSISGMIISKIFPRHNVTYGVSKAGVAHLTRGLASEWAQHNIRVNALAPGYMLTASTQTSRKFPEIVERLTEMTPMKRYGEPWELKGAVVFLASQASSFMTGSILVIDGGNTIW
ncbi:MAG TPA: SDR family oxidoreductase [Candidatus Hydrogenedentes bacterium]|nr:SDR family oxidoreductase [Candidatus Hydrogenedentota bacterium]